MKKFVSGLTGVALSLATTLAIAGPAASGVVEKQPLNIHAIVMFFIFVLGTLAITWWAASKTQSTSDFYTAGGGITGFQNGLAIAGDYMSAATLLGLSSLVFSKGYDGFIYTVGFFVGWPIITFLMAERLRNLGRFTFADIASYRLDQTKIRTFAAFGSLTVVCFLSDRTDGGCGSADSVAVRSGLPYRCGGSGCLDAGVCDFRRHDCNHLGANH